ncbi:hypothetical protein ABQG65_08930 [Yersinia alsatica]|uniref:hypothetical protein n=1 Tax=Yersinia alsatica TaxID=2890317 RepID=UPI0032EE306A
MARRKELMGIANGLIGSFNSRNNDINGYWAIGQLKSFAISNELKSIYFDLWPPGSTTSVRLVSKVNRNYTIKLLALLSAQKISLDWIKKVTIAIQFIDVTPTSLEIFRFSLGEFYRCTCEITNDNGNYYVASDYGFCLPHSQSEELKRHGS